MNTDIPSLIIGLVKSIDPNDIITGLQNATPIATAIIIGGTSVFAINKSFQTLVTTIKGTDQGGTTSLKLEAQKIVAFDGSITNWNRWKNRTECALDGSGYERILSDASYALKNKKMNKVVYSQLAVATVDGTAHHIVNEHSETKDGHQAWTNMKT